MKNTCRSCRLVLIMMHLLQRSCAWFPVHALTRQHPVERSLILSRHFRTFSSRSGNVKVDEEGRQIRRRSGGRRDDFDPVKENSSSGQSSGGGWHDFDPVKEKSFSGRLSRGGWDDFDPMDDSTDTHRRPPPPKRNRIRNDSGRNGSRSTYNRSSSRPHRSLHRDKVPSDRKINLKALEGAGFVHLYGLSSVLNALKADRRDFTPPESLIDLNQLEAEDLDHEMKQLHRKPEAQFCPWLFVQERSSPGNRNPEKVMAAEQVERLAEERGVPIARVDKGVLNALSGNRPHQGYVLRCGALSFEPLSRIPDSSNLWLVLDEVVDPQNLGALLRSAYFFGNTAVVVCSKNSAPPSPVVSAASAGALEVANVWSTSNLPRTLQKAQEDGFRIVGASSSQPPGEGASLYELNELPKDNRPTILVLGSEGSGLRTLVAKACTDFVRIPGGSGEPDDEEDASGVDSLNVSVTGGILLWHLLHQQ